MHRTILYFGLAVAAYCHLRASTAAEEGRYALLVGVEKYDPSELAPLQYAEDDVQAIGTALEKLGFSVVTMTSDAEVAARRPVLPEDILAQLDRRLADRETTDTVVLAFSGHGVQLKSDPIDEKTKAKELWFCPERARPEDPRTMLAMSEVIRRLEKCGAGRKLLLVDACRNDFEPPNGSKSGRVVELPAAGLKRPAIPAGMVAMFSCRPGEQSFEIKTLGHSIFSHHVIEYLEGRAPADRYRRGEVGVSELTSYVKNKTRTLAEEKLDRSQMPEVFSPTGAFGDWPLGKVASTGEGPGAGGFPRVDVRPAVLLPREPAAGRRAGQVVENSLGMKLVVIPAGEFQMGSDETKERLRREITAVGIQFNESADTADERPVHRVRITKPFLMGQTEVTLGQFLQFYHDGFEGRLDCEKDGKGGWGYDPTSLEKPWDQKPNYRPWSWGFDGQTNNHPVVNVSWNDCVAFCEWLSQKEGKKYRLPTEAEWEYACRAGTPTRYWFGEDFEKLADHDNVGDQTAKDRFRNWGYHIKSRDGFAFTAPVGSYRRPNPFGLHDMHGNVSELLNDRYDKSFYAISPLNDPSGPENGSRRVIKPGSWDSDPMACRSTARYYVTPTERKQGCGFRVVCELE